MVLKILRDFLPLNGIILLTFVAEMQFVSCGHARNVEKIKSLKCLIIEKLMIDYISEVIVAYRKDCE
jgi:hypothetical protein